MGDVVNRARVSGWRRPFLPLAIGLVVLGLACTSSKPARVVEAAPVGEKASAPAAGQPAVAAAASEIRSMELREGAPEVFLDLTASAPLVWTSFRNADGQVVLELPNSRPGPDLADLAPADGLVASVRVEREAGSRPLTRLVVQTRQDVEHSVSANGADLELRLAPVEAEEPKSQAGLAFEPVPEDRAAAAPAADERPLERAAENGIRPAPEPAMAMAGGEGIHNEPARLGTVEAPAVAPPPTGAPATRLNDVEVIASGETGETTVVRIAGDGEFPYSTFALGSPDRFVIDLSGVVNRSARPTLAFAGGAVERVRVAQFKPQPQPVARVVFDLRREAVPRIERTADALVVSFPDAGGAPTVQTAALAPSAVPEPAVASPLAEPEREPAATAPPPPEPVRPQTQVARRQDPQIEVEEAPERAPAPAAPQPSDLAMAKPAAPKPAAAAPAKAPAAPSIAAAPAAAPLASGPSVGTTGSSAIDSFASQSLGQTERTYVGEPIDLKVTNADVTDVLRTFSQISGLNIVVQPGIHGVVTAELENVPWDQALEQVLKINGLGYELEGNVMRIAPTRILREEAQERQELTAARALAVPLRTVMKRLSYADARQVAALLQTGQSSILSKRGSVLVDDRTNTLIISELPAFLDTVIAVIENLDTPEPQVMIEARIIETTKRFSRSLGIDWGFDAVADAAHGNTTGLVFPSNVSGAGDVNLATGGNNGLLNFRLGNVLNTFTLDFQLQAAESEGLINIISAPKVATLNNQQATIQSGLQIPIQTVANNTVTVQFVNATLRLDVVPQVTAEGTILMDIVIQKREPQLAFLVPGATNAPISTKEAATRVIVRDGGTTVIGGIYKVNTDDGESRVPGLANIPLIGQLFRNKTVRNENEELLIFITPRIIKL